MADPTMSGLALGPAMDHDAAPGWDGGRWIGELDQADPRLSGELIELAGADGYRNARILIRDGIAPQGFVEVPIAGGAVASADLAARIGLLSPADPPPAGYPTPPITVAVTTRNRPHRISVLVDSLLALDYPEFEILIVDNASSDHATVDVVRAVDDPRVRVVGEPRPGAARGRNRAMLDARHEIIAFVDDDVVVDPRWLHGVAIGFSRSPAAGIVTGMVATGELRSTAQQYFEDRISWEVTTGHRIFTLTDPPADVPLFPFEIGLYGTGANFAITRTLALRLGGMNEALGTGSPSGGGEDIDLFVRAMYAGADLVYEPCSIVWHRHREEVAELGFQLMSYGRGMGAWIGCMLTGRQTRRDAFRLVLRATRRVGKVGAPVTPSDNLPAEFAGLRRREVLGMLSGPLYYLRARLQGRRPRPLL